jgi:hypothetical protein
VPSIRDIRLATGHSQRAFAVLLGVPFETYRPLDSCRLGYHPRLRAAQVRTNCGLIVLTDWFWRDRLGAPSQVLGSRIRVGGTPVEFRGRAESG